MVLHGSREDMKDLAPPREGLMVPGEQQEVSLAWWRVEENDRAGEKSTSNRELRRGTYGTLCSMTHKPA